MDPQLFAIIAVFMGGGSVFALALKRTWSKSDRADDAFLRGYERRTTESETTISQLRAEWDARFDAQERAHSQAMQELSDHVDRLHRALAQLVPLVSAEHVAEATRIVMELSVKPIPNSRRNP